MGSRGRRWRCFTCRRTAARGAGVRPGPFQPCWPGGGHGDAGACLAVVPAGRRAPGRGRQPARPDGRHANEDVNAATCPGLTCGRRDMGQVTRRAAGTAACAAALLWFAGLAYAGPLSAAKPAGLSRGGSGMRAQGPAARCWRAAATVTAGPTPFAAATDPKTDRIYVANGGVASKYQGTVSVINGRTNRVIKTIRVGREADSVAVNSATNRIFVTNDISGTVSVISGRTLRVIATVRVGANPSDVAVNARTGAAYVTNAVNGTVSVIRGPRYRVTATIGSGSGPSDIAVNPSTGLLYVADRAGNDDNTIA